ncbi:MAG: leucine-rich repeat domain-containing protein [Candidatus Coproplasma sp.]
MERKTEITVNNVKYRIKKLTPQSIVAVVVGVTDKNIISADIQAEVCGYPVEIIGRYALRDCKLLKTVILPDSIKKICECAFTNCYSLSIIEIPESVIEIDKEAFLWCCRLKNLTIPANVKTIGTRAFSNCITLNDIQLHEGITHIGAGAFSCCNCLTSIKFPASVTKIEMSVLSDCSALESILVDKNNTVYHSSGNCLIKNANKKLIAGCKNSVIPTDKSVKIIGTDAFCGNKELTHIKIPDCITRIDDEAFFGCEGLTSIEIPNSVKVIGERAFEKCTSLKSIFIPESVKSIGRNSSIFPNAFVCCIALEEIIVGEYNETYHSSGNCIIETASGKLISGCKNSIIPTDGSVTSIGRNAFMECKLLTKIEIPKSIVSIDFNAFKGCTGLSDIILPERLTNLGCWAFSECAKLTKVTIPENLTKIGQGAFSHCTNLEIVNINSAFVRIDLDAFSGCPALKIIKYIGTYALWEKLKNWWAFDMEYSNYVLYCKDGLYLRFP